MTHRSLLAALIIAATSPFAAMACSFDTDCAVGSQCVKARGQIYGICKGGMQPGNRYDREPVVDSLDPNRTHGNTCSFDVDCGPGSSCEKDRGQIEGVCVRRR